MTPQNLKIYALIKAKEADLEGMKAENTGREQLGLSIAYTESYFVHIANEIMDLANQIQHDDAQS